MTIIISILGENILSINEVVRARDPAIPTTRQPYLLINAPTIGPTIRNVRDVLNIWMDRTKNILAS